MDALDVSRLKAKIDEALCPLVNGDYVYLGLPYHPNIGDTLIWEGTKRFLANLPYRCLYATDNRYFYPRTLSKGTPILLHGGGNFGDLYRQHSLFRKSIIERYPGNRIIVLPQSAYYRNETVLAEDVGFYASHPNVTLCARDSYSYNFLKRQFKNPCLLVPDMAFYMDVSKFHLSPDKGKVLFFKRTDQELVSEVRHSSIPADAEVRDWPTCETELRKYAFIELAFRPVKAIGWLLGGREYKNKVEDFKRDHFYRKSYVQLGIDFMSPYSVVYTTRLHGMILGLLLGKKIYLIDNCSGKIVNFYKTWLAGVEGEEII